MSTWTPYAIPSGRQTSSALVSSGQNIVSAIAIFTDGTNDATLTVYDNTAASGTIVWGPHTVKGEDLAGGPPITIPFIVDNGLYCKIEGTGAYYHVFYVEASIWLKGAKAERL